MAQYDVIIIGGGPRGSNAAIRSGQLGLKVACVDKGVNGGDTLGGTCLNVGCMPSKALLHASEMFAAANGGVAKLGVAGAGGAGVGDAAGQTTMLEARNIVIATGSEPAGLPGVTVDQDRIVDSTG